MNKERRKRLNMVVDSLVDNQSILESVMEDESDVYENMPDGLKESDRGCTMEENIETLDEIVSDISELIDKINDLLDNN